MSRGRSYKDERAGIWRSIYKLERLLADIKKDFDAHYHYTEILGEQEPASSGPVAAKGRLSADDSRDLLDAWHDPFHEEWQGEQE